MSKSTRESDSARAVLSLDTAIQRVLAELEARRILSEQSLPKVRDAFRRFERFIRATQGVGELRAVTPEAALAFVASPHAEGEPAIATKHLRRCAIRLLFRIARELGLAEGDPTLDLRLPPRSSLQLRPLTDDEIAVGRSFSLETLSSTRPSAAWALAEATATTSEIPNIRIGDLRLEEGRVWIDGATKTDPRWGQLDEWARIHVERRLRALPDTEPDRPVVYEGRGSAESRQASSCLAISGTLVKAGLGGEPDVRPASVAAWAGARLFAEGVPIDEVARRLGKRSLDRTARFIGLDWRRSDG